MKLFAVGSLLALVAATAVSACKSSPPSSIVPLDSDRVVMTKQSEFKCQNSNQSISIFYQCDRDDDCEDRSDEFGCCFVEYSGFANLKYTGGRDIGRNTISVLPGDTLQVSGCTLGRYEGVSYSICLPGQWDFTGKCIDMAVGH